MNSIDKNSRNCWLLAFLFLALAAASSLPAADITGKVRDASGDNAMVVIDGDTLPIVGDSAEIFFKIPGADEEISVATGKVAAVEAKVVKVTIEKATGTVEKDQLARIKSGSTPTTSAVSPSPAASPSAPAPTTPSIVGDWVDEAGREDTYSFSFKADGTLLWIKENAETVSATAGKYRTDPSTKPQTIELFDFQEVEMKNVLLRGIFEFQSDGRLKLDFVKQEQEPLKDFSQKARVFSKAPSPIVRPNQPLPTPSVASTPSAPSPTPSRKKAKFHP